MPAIGACAAAGLVATFATGTAPAALKTVAAGKVTVITVTPGKPSELAFKLSKSSSVPAGPITFKVTNLGVAFHNFKICTSAVASAAAAKNSCNGKATAVLHHGQSATLTVTLAKSGLYEFLCTVTGHAAAGMKGLLGVGVAVTTAEQSTAAHANPTSAASPTPTPPAPTTTTKPGSGSGGTGDTSGCAPGVSIKTSGNADADGDELGTEPDDNDGCV
jgi:uncharacterized cupredoxin-like copper-binding protein